MTNTNTTPAATSKTYRLADGFTFTIRYEAGEHVPVTATYTRGGKVETGDLVTERDELIALREAYLAHVRELVERYPAQAANVPHYQRLAATARLGRMRSDVTTKGALCTLKTGELVLVWKPEFNISDSATVWHPRNPCETGLQRWTVEVVA